MKTNFCKIALVGVGYWGEKLLTTLISLPHIQVKYCCDISEKIVHQKKYLSPFSIWTTRYADILQDNSIDAIFIATPLITHYLMVSQALVAKKHVFVEKPFVENLSEALEIKELAAKNNKTVMVDNTYLYDLGIHDIKKIIIDGTLGKLYLYDSVRLGYGIFREQENVIWDLAVHDLAIIDYLFNKEVSHIKTLHSSISQIVDTAVIQIKYPNNFFANINVSWLSPNKIRLIRIVGEKGIAIYQQLPDNSRIIKVYKKDSCNSVLNEIRSKKYSHTFRRLPLTRICSKFIEIVSNNKIEISEINIAIKIQGTLEVIDKNVN